MLLVRTYLAPSRVHGIGLFAAEPISRGTIIWRFDERIDRRFRKAEIDAMPEPLKSYLGTYSYPEAIGSETYLLDGDHARFMNHSDQPNTDATVDTVAIRDIAAGEELLCDYREFHPTHAL
ncbi:MAG TPA: SET domain-containing protein-lysine N-methyltransferase [Azospirillaceae bacterium]|nr:SET domain-containing protein-lysine N-methyltransferase [Azospirillaceae bacterium]